MIRECFMCTPEAARKCGYALCWATGYGHEAPRDGEHGFIGEPPGWCNCGEWCRTADDWNTHRDYVDGLE